MSRHVPAVVVWADVLLDRRREAVARLLIGNLERRVHRAAPRLRVTRLSGCLAITAVDSASDLPVDDVIDVARSTCGVRHVRGVQLVEHPNARAVDEAIEAALPSASQGSFAVRVRRLDKNWPETSLALQRRLAGTVLHARPQWTVELKRPTVLVRVEWRRHHVFVSIGAAVDGVGGRVVGERGRAWITGESDEHLLTAVRDLHVEGLTVDWLGTSPLSARVADAIALQQRPPRWVRNIDVRAAASHAAKAGVRLVRVSAQERS